MIPLLSSFMELVLDRTPLILCKILCSLSCSPQGEGVPWEKGSLSNLDMKQHLWHGTADRCHRSGMLKSASASLGCAMHFCPVTCTCNHTSRSSFWYQHRLHAMQGTGHSV